MRATPNEHDVGTLEPGDLDQLTDQVPGWQQLTAIERARAGAPGALWQAEMTRKVDPGSRSARPDGRQEVGVQT